jgi:hypothetical protein
MGNTIYVLKVTFNSNPSRNRNVLFGIALINGVL